MLFGYDTGTINGILAMKYWRDEFSTGYRNKDGDLDVSASQSAEIVSLLSAGTFFGALFAAPTADFLGRRYGLVSSTVVFTLGVILQTASTAIPMFVAGRFFAGFGVGMISALIPLYQSETVGPHEYSTGSVLTSTGTKMDPWDNRRRISARHYDWSFDCCSRRPFYRQPQRLWIIPYPHRRTIRMGYHHFLWYALAAGDASHVHQTRLS